MNRSLTTGLAALALVAGTAVSAPAAHADDGEIETTGNCSMRSDWKLKAKPEDGRRLEVEFEVDSNRVGQTWTVVLRDNGVRFFSGQRVTQAPSGSLEVERYIANRVGPDRITAVATHAATGERCVGALTFRG